MDNEYIVLPNSKSDTGKTYLVPKYRKVEAEKDDVFTKKEFESALRKIARPIMSQDDEENSETSE